MRTPPLIATALAAALAAALAGCSSDTAAPPLGEGFFPSGDAQIAYSLDFPSSGTAPYPAVVLVHGSGRVTRDQLSPFAARFLERGYAVLRYDKRGVGQSTGSYSGVGTANSETVLPLLASDAAAAVALLRSRAEIDAPHVGLAGGSQAGWIIPVAAELAGGVDFAIMIVGPAVSVGMEIYYSSLFEQTSRPLSEAPALLDAFGGPHGFDPLPYLTRATTPTLWLTCCARSAPRASRSRC